MLGLYALLERLLNAFPDLLLEGCSGGGGRFDPGMLYYSPQIWTSDDTDPIERLTIQAGTSIVYPPSSMSAHVSASPNHQTRRNNPLSTRGIVAMGGSFGYELDISKMTGEEKEEIAQQVQQYHAYAPIIRNGDYYRLLTSREATAWEIVAADGETVLLGYVLALGRVRNIRIIKLQGLDENALYRDEQSGKVYAGGMLMHAGINLSPLWLRDREGVMLCLKKVK
jgi:alpha-galactosidase